MKKLGGYKLIDFGGVDISTSKTISGIYEKIEKTEKRIVGCNLKLGTTTFKELTLDVKKDDTNLVLSNSIIKVTITNANAVVGETPFELSGYSAEYVEDENWNKENVYTSVALNGAKLTFVCACNIIAKKDVPAGEFGLITFKMPSNIFNKLYPTNIGGVDSLLTKVNVSLTPSSSYSTQINGISYCQKYTADIRFSLIFDTTGVLEGSKYYVRVEATFLLGDNLISE